MPREIKGRQLSAAGEPPERVLDQLDELEPKARYMVNVKFSTHLIHLMNSEEGQDTLFIHLWHAGLITKEMVDRWVAWAKEQ